MTHPEGAPDADGGIDIGEQIGDFSVVDRLGGGCYRAVQLGNSRDAVLHVGGATTAIDPDGLDALDHPGISPVIAHGATAQRRPWIAWEHVDGMHLHDLLANRLMAPAEVAHLIHHVADALAAAHRAGIVHRALTPRSITLVGTGFAYPVVVRDWGLRYRRRNAFTAPEGDGDGRVDVYALGVIAYRAATGKLPKGTPVALPDAPAALSRLVSNMLAPAPCVRLMASEVAVLAAEIEEALCAALEVTCRTPPPLALMQEPS